jgi:hypothetical protein
LESARQALLLSLLLGIAAFFGFAMQERETLRQILTG